MPQADEGKGWHPRYSRQVLFGGIGNEGQARIVASRVALVGCGALAQCRPRSLCVRGLGRCVSSTGILWRE